uniref:Probable G-protein coupled receptor 160 n=2 Tax=Mastacembelus armatus TaxID=205130 RepID=A0A7N8WQY4_9TELE
MLAIIEQWEDGSGCHTDNADKYLLLMLFKLGLDIVVFYLSSRRFYTSFLSMCSLSIVLADLVMTFCIATVWFLGTGRSLVSLCFLLATASATYAALPIPIICLGTLDYYLENYWICNQRTFCKVLRTIVFTLLVWMLAVFYSFGSAKTELVELDYETGTNLLVCEVEESTLVNYLTLGLLITVLFAATPFWSRIPQWVKEADRLSELREEQENQRSDLFTSTNCMETKACEQKYLNETVGSRPPLWFSLTLGFATFWVPYLVVTVGCLAFGFGVPAYITINLLWLECTNSLLVGLLFWAKSKTLGPYSHLPENMCLWHIYWHLSKGTQQHQLPAAVFNPSKGEKNTFLSV